MDAVLTSKKKARKKRLIILGIVVAVIGALFAACSAMSKAAKKQLEAMMTAQTGQVQMRDLISSVGATGKVVSLRSKDITAGLSGLEILDISVEVGDTVQAGQTLVTFDTGDIAEDLAAARRALYQTQQRNEISAADAQRGVDDAVRNRDYQLDTAAQNADKAYESYLNGQDDLQELRNAENEAGYDWRDARDTYYDLIARQEEVEWKLLNLQEEPAEPEGQEEWAAQIALLEQERGELTVAVSQAEAAFTAAEQALKQAETAVKNMERNVDALYDSYTAAVRNYENMVAVQASAVAAAQSGQQTAAISVNTDSQQKQVDLYAGQLEDGVVTAPFEGIITAINFDPGDLYTQGPLLTVQDCSAFEISAQIGQYDISDIALGQKVRIKTDATREQELEGTVIFIAPTATVAAGMQTDPTYEVRISVDTDTDRLRLDMSANLSVIISEHKNCLTVPYNAVQTAEDGSYFVEVVEEDETVTMVPVEVILESNYYTEIAGGLKEGQQVKLIDEGSSMLDMFEAMAANGGGF